MSVLKVGHDLMVKTDKNYTSQQHRTEKNTRRPAFG